MEDDAPEHHAHVAGVEDQELDSGAGGLHPQHGPAVALVLEVDRAGRPAPEVVQQPLEHGGVAPVPGARPVEVHNLAVDAAVGEEGEDLRGAYPLPGVDQPPAQLLVSHPVETLLPRVLDKFLPGSMVL